MSEKIKSQFERIDDFNPSTKFDNKFQEHWIHKQVVKITGDTEDDFIIEEKAVMIDKVNIWKQIQEEAKTTDLKELLRQFALSGDETIFNRRSGFFGDVSQIQEAVENGSGVIDPEVIKSTLPKELQSLSVEELSRMSDEQIISYFEQVRKQKEAEKVEIEKSNDELEEGEENE